MASPVTSPSDSQAWGEESESDALYTISLKRVRYYSDRKADEVEPVARLQWETCKIRTLKAGTLDRLVANLAPADQDVDPSYMQTFLCTFRAFTDAGTVLGKLIERFRASAAGDESSEVKEQIKKNVVSVVKFWVEVYPDDFTQPTDVLLRSLGRFVDSTKGIKIKLDKLKSHYRAKTAATSKSPAAKRSSYLEFGNCLMKLLPKIIAEQLTILDCELFCAVIPYHCMGCFWGKRNKAELASTVYRTVDHFNHITMLVSTSILLARAADRGQLAVKEEALARAKVAEKWIDIGSECRKLKNFSSLKAILSGLQCSAIYRLKKTWSCIARESKDVYEELSRLFSQDKNQEKSRELLMKEGTAKYGQDSKLTRKRRKSRDPSGVIQGVVPYLGTFLTDLMMVDTAHPSRLEDGLINFEKRRKEFEILAQLSLFQKSALNYKLKADKHFQETLKNAERLKEHECYKLSLKVEPGPEVVDVTGPNRPLSISKKIKNFFGSRGDLSSAGDATAGSPVKDTTTLTVPSSFMQMSSSSTDLSGAGSGDSEPRRHRRRTPSFSEVMAKDSVAIKVALSDDQAMCCVYKSILLRRDATTENVISLALEKHGLYEAPKQYRLIQITESKKPNVIPENVSVFFFIDTTCHDFKFVLEKIQTAPSYSERRLNRTKSSTLALATIKSDEVTEPGSKLSWKEFERLHSSGFSKPFRASFSLSRSNYELSNGLDDKSATLQSLIAPSSSSCLVKVGIESADVQHCVYKSVLLTSNDHTESVIRSALEKFSFPVFPDLYRLMYSPYRGKSVPLPDGSNVFYAIDRASDSVRLIVRDKELGESAQPRVVEVKQSKKGKKQTPKKEVFSTKRTAMTGMAVPLFARQQLSLSLTGIKPSRSIDCVPSLAGNYAPLTTMNHIIRVGLKDSIESSCLYKSLLVTERNRASDVIASALEKLGVDGTVDEFSLYQVINSKKGSLLEIPSDANVFYAMNATSEDHKFLLQRKSSSPT